MSKQSIDPAKSGKNKNSAGGKKGTRWSTIPQRRKIINLYNKEKSVKDIVEETGVSKWVVYKVIAGKIKTDYKPRADKGLSRKQKEVLENSALSPDGSPHQQLTDFNDVDEYIDYEIFKACEHLNKTKLQPEDRIKLISQVSKLQQQIHKRRMESLLKRGDAEIIAQLIRRYVPDATDDQIILIYKEELQKFEATQ